jgi:hypothetical protein
MAHELSQLQHVTLERPYQLLHDDTVRNLLLDNCRLKLAGYGDNISPDYVSLDNWDFIGIHEICCLRENGRLIPMMSYKSCPLEHSLKHRVAFPGLSCVSFPGLEAFKQAAETYLAESAQAGKKVTYIGSFTMNPHITDRRLKAALYRIYLAQTRWHLLSQNLDRIIALAMLQFNTNTSFVKMGFSPLKEGEFKTPFLFNQDAELWKVDVKDMPDSLKKSCDEMQDYWDKRWVITGDPAKHKPQAA